MKAARNSLTLTAEEPLARKFIEVWDRVHDPFYALTGMQTAVNIVDDNAVTLRPAMICSGATPTVYISRRFVTEVLSGKSEYPESFLAFVIGHELGHRLNDLDCDGKKRSFATSETLADKRAVFFASVAGYSVSELAGSDYVDRYLATETDASVSSRKERAHILHDTLKQYPLYEGLYQNALTLTLAGKFPQAADRLLRIADERMFEDAIPMPELGVLRAIVMMEDARPHAPWLEKMQEFSADASNLRCAPVLAGRTMLEHDIARNAKLMGSGPSSSAQQKKRAIAQLREASRLLDDAEREGISPFITENLRACVDYYSGKPRDALGHLETARSHAPKDESKELSQTTRANETLLGFYDYLKDNPVPEYAGKETERWVEGFRAKYPKNTHAQLDAILERMVTSEASTSPTAKAPSPTAKPVFPEVTFPTSPPISSGQCLEGMSFVGSVPSTEEQSSSGMVSYGVLYCKRKDDSPVKSVSRVHLTSTLSPPYEKVALDIFTLDRFENNSIENARARCPDLVLSGTTLEGHAIWSGKCEAFSHVGLFVRDGNIQRADVLRWLD